MKKLVSGYCPVAEENMEISVTYIYSESFREAIWVKDKADCPVAGSGLCSAEVCPLRSSLPENIKA